MRILVDYYRESTAPRGETGGMQPHAGCGAVRTRSRGAGTADWSDSAQFKQRGGNCWLLQVYYAYAINCCRGACIRPAAPGKSTRSTCTYCQFHRFLLIFEWPPERCSVSRADSAR